MVFHRSTKQTLFLIATTILLSGCVIIGAMNGAPDPRPEEAKLALTPKPTTKHADSPWTWQYSTVGIQPIKASLVAASEDGQRLLIQKQGPEEGLDSGESSDGGQTWSFGPRRPKEVWSPNMLHAVRPDTNQLSHDGGLSWSALPAGSRDSRWFVSDSGAVVTYSYGLASFAYLPPGSVWKTIVLPDGAIVEAVFVGAGGQFIVNGIEYSGDDGATWQVFLPNVGTFRVAARVAADGAISLLDQDGTRARVRRSTDQGATWWNGPWVSVGDRDLSHWLSSDGLRVALWNNHHRLRVTWDGGATWVQPALDEWIGQVALWGVEQGATTKGEWLGLTNDEFESLTLITQPGLALDSLVVSADGSSVTGVLHTPSGDKAWVTTDGLNWTSAPTPAPLPPLAGLSRVLDQSPDGEHGIGYTSVDSWSGSSLNDYDSWVAVAVRIFSGGTTRQVAKAVYTTWGETENVGFEGALSADGRVVSLSITRDEAGWGNFISTNGGQSWWRSNDVVVLAWSADGTQGLGLKDGSLATSADQGVSWAKLPDDAPNARDAVFFAKGIILAGDPRGVAFGLQEANQ